MRVHYSTLGKVRLFRGCDVTFLRDAVLQLQPVVLLPGDFVFRQASAVEMQQGDGCFIQQAIQSSKMYASADVAFLGKDK